MDPKMLLMREREGYKDALDAVMRAIGEYREKANLIQKDIDAIDDAINRLTQNPLGLRVFMPPDPEPQPDA